MRMEFIKSNLWEIKKSSATAIFGAVVSLGHLLIFYDWYLKGHLPLQLAADIHTLCWPLFKECDFWLTVPQGLYKFSYWSYFVLSLMALLIFLFTRLYSLAWFLLNLVFVCFCFLYFRDYRLSTNDHYFWLLVSFFYLYVPSKDKTLRYFIVSYWIATGLIHLRAEWMTGIEILKHVTLPAKLAEWFAALSVLATTIVPFGLLIRDGRFLTSSVFLLGGLEVLLWQVYGFFSPSMSLLALSLFILHFFEQRKLEREYIYQSFIRPEPSRLWTITALGLFWFGQLAHLVPGEYPWVKTAGQTVGLTPILAIEECQSFGFATYEKETVQVTIQPAGSNTEIQCQPRIIFSEMRELCNKLATSATSGSDSNALKSIAVSFWKRGFREVEFQKIFSSSDICAADLTLEKVLHVQ